MLVTLAFYKGHGKRLINKLQDKAIRLRTGGKYSHVELIEGATRLDIKAKCLSSSVREGGVRQTSIFLDRLKWDLLILPVSDDAAEFIRQRISCRYDYLGIFLSQAITANVQDQSRWFCSEIIAAAIGFKNPHRFSPPTLHDALAWCAHNRISIE